MIALDVVGHPHQLVHPVVLRERREDRLVQPAAQELHLLARREGAEPGRGTRGARPPATRAAGPCSGARAGRPGGARALRGAAGMRGRRPPRTPSRSCRPAGGYGSPAPARSGGPSCVLVRAGRLAGGGSRPRPAPVPARAPGRPRPRRPAGTAARRTRGACGSWRSARSCSRWNCASAGPSARAGRRRRARSTPGRAPPRGSGTGPARRPSPARPRRGWSRGRRSPSRCRRSSPRPTSRRAR